MPLALVVDDDRQVYETVATAAGRRGFTVDAAPSLVEARTRIAERPPDLLLVNREFLDGAAPGAIVEALDRRATEVVVLAAQATVSIVVEALRYGANDFLMKPLDARRLDSILASLGRRLPQARGKQPTRLPPRGTRFGALIGASRQMEQVHALIARVAPTSATVLLHGESGTGKELAAQTIHQLSRRSRGPMVALNCSAIPPQLIESELFGHERGSFTGADRQHRGYFERADGGTLFLDEVTEMVLDLQAKLLRTLETGCIVRTGGERDVAVDVRIVAATNADPEEAVRRGRFRRDLLYRLNVFPIHLPPLRERTGDVELLAHHFLAQLNDEEGAAKRLTRAALDRLRTYPWPGNVRELRNALHHAFIVADEEIDAASVPLGGALRVGPAVAGEPPNAVVLRPGTSIAEAERRLILSTLEACCGDKRDAARSLGISLKTLYNRLKTYSGWSNGSRRDATDVLGGPWSAMGRS
jgi:two-component system response regulator AtoC